MNLQVLPLRVLVSRQVIKDRMDYTGYLAGKTKSEMDILDRLAGKFEVQTSEKTVERYYGDKEDKDKGNFAKICQDIKGSKNGKTIGVFAKDKFPGAFMDLWREAIKPEGLMETDLSAQFGYLMAPKEESEVSTIKKAAGLSSDLFSKYLKEQIMDIIDGDKKKSHSKLCKDIEEQIANKAVSYTHLRAHET